MSTEAQREAVSEKSRELEDWLYESDGEPASTFVEKRGALEGLWAAVVSRAEEAEARPKAVAKFQSALDAAKLNATEVWATEKPWLQQLDLDDLVAKVDKAQAWLDDSVAAQAKLEAHDDPAFKVSDLGLKLKPVATLATRLAPQKKPTHATGVNKNDAAANAQLAAAVRRSCARIVRRASAGQSLKGLLTAGGARAAAYVGAKLLRRAAG